MDNHGLVLVALLWEEHTRFYDGDYDDNDDKCYDDDDDSEIEYHEGGSAYRSTGNRHIPCPIPTSYQTPLQSHHGHVMTSYKRRVYSFDSRFL
jgi:hypothetical protein